MLLYLWGLAPRYTHYSNLLLSRRKKQLLRSNLFARYTTWDTSTIRRKWLLLSGRRVPSFSQIFAYVHLLVAQTNRCGRIFRTDLDISFFVYL